MRNSNKSRGKRVKSYFVGVGTIFAIATAIVLVVSLSELQKALLAGVICGGGLMIPFGLLAYAIIQVNNRKTNTEATLPLGGGVGNGAYIPPQLPAGYNYPPQVQGPGSVIQHRKPRVFTVVGGDTDTNNTAEDSWTFDL
jgi:hypothetical protein